ncbi:hypothetical protein Tco_0077638 [Tanacetum coccineum]
MLLDSFPYLDYLKLDHCYLLPISLPELFVSSHGGSVWMHPRQETSVAVLRGIGPSAPALADAIGEIESVKLRCGAIFLKFLLYGLGLLQPFMVLVELLKIGEDVLKSQFPRLFALEPRKDISVAEKMSHFSFAFSFRRLPRGGIKEDQFSNLISCTSAFILPQIEDRWVWSLSSTGDFSVNYARSFIDDKLLLSFDSPTIWVI